MGGSLEEEKFHFEARLIRRALDQANGRITDAAKILGITHQGLGAILWGRHKTTLGGARTENVFAEADEKALNLVKIYLR